MAYPMELGEHEIHGGNWRACLSDSRSGPSSPLRSRRAVEAVAVWFLPLPSGGFLAGPAGLLPVARPRHHRRMPLVRLKKLVPCRPRQATAVFCSMVQFGVFIGIVVRRGTARRRVVGDD